jgi:hypothetical protein
MPVITTQQSTTIQVPLDMTTLLSNASSDDVLSTLESDHIDGETDQTTTVEWTTWIAVTTTNLSREMENTIWTTETTQETTTNGSIPKDLLTLPTTISDETTSMSTTTDALETTSTTPFMETITTDTAIKWKTTVSSSSTEKPSTTFPFPTESRKPENWGLDGQEREMNNFTTPVSPISFPFDSTKMTTRTVISYSTPFDDQISTTTPSATTTLSTTLRNEKRTEDVTAGVTTIHQPTDGRPPEADLVSITLEPEIDTATTASASIDLDIPLSIHPHPEESNTTDTPSLPTDPFVAITTLPTDLDTRNQTTTVKAIAGEYPLMEPTYPALSPGIPAGSCTSEICLNGGTCVMTQEGWQVHTHVQLVNRIFHNFLNLITF